MPPKLNPLPELIPNRIFQLREKLRGGLWQDRKDLDAAISPISDTPLPVEQAYTLPYRPIQSGEYFGEPFGEWQQCWFRVDVPAPSAGEAGRRYFFWDCRGETTVYIDGQPWAGLDVAHPYCSLPDKACTLWLDCGTYQTCIWSEGKPIDQYGLRYEGAWTACRNPQVWETFWDLDVLVEWLAYLLKRDNLGEMVRPWGPYPAPRTAHPVLRKALAMFDEAYLAWETDAASRAGAPLDATGAASRAGAPLNAAGGLAALGPALKRIYAAFPAESWQPKINMLGHSHLDLVWMWPEVEGERKAVHTIATALRLLDEYPQYRFMWTSPHSMKLLETRFPALYQAVRQRIQEGRWEATGGAWVEFDTLIACGEALGRSLALGQRYQEKLRGSITTTVWLPDCFGFNGFLPQIMALAGIKNFYTSKLSWSAITDFPYDSFVWRSADGSEVITHLDVSGPSYDSLPGMIESSQNYHELAANDEILKYTGIGDGGGGTTVDRVELYNRLGSLAQVPRVEWGSVEGFFDRLALARAKLPVFEGELYLEFHRGIYTTQSEFKRAYRRLERALQAWEAARVFTSGGPIPESYWERLSFTQFHDALPGSSIKLVYDQLGQELLALGSQALEQAGAELVEERRGDTETRRRGDTEAAVAVFNPLAIDRRVVVELDTPEATHLPVQKVSSPEGSPDGSPGGQEKWLASVELKGLEMHILDGSGKAPAQTAAPSDWEVTPTVLDNGVLRVEFDDRGQIIRVDDGKPWPLASAPGLVLHPDNPPTFDAWEMDHCLTRQSVAAITGLPLKVIEQGPVRAVLSGFGAFGEASCVQVKYILEAGSAVLRVELTVDWLEEHRALRYYLPTSVRGRSARYGAPYGSIERPQAPGTPREEAMWEVPASRWAAVCDDLRQDGLAIITEAKYGFSCRDGELAFTLLRAALDPAADSPNPRRHLPAHSPDRGQHTIRFALARHHAHTTAGQLSTAALAEALFAPVVSLPVQPGIQQQPPFCFTSELDTLVPTWVLPAAQPGAYIFRLNETGGASGAISIAFAKPPAAVIPVDFLERPLDGVCLQQTAPAEYRLDYRPYQLISLLVKAEQ